MNEKQTKSVKNRSQVDYTDIKLASQVKPTIPLEPVRPTKKQKELLSFIEAFIIEHGYSPSYREIMNGLQYNSVATVALHVGNLIKRGHIVKRDHNARSLEIVSSGTEAEPAIKTNEVKVSEEKWLIGKIEKLFSDAEAEALPTQAQLDDIAILLAALRVLGLEGAAQSFVARQKSLADTLKR